MRVAIYILVFSLTFFNDLAGESEQQYLDRPLLIIEIKRAGK